MVESTPQSVDQSERLKLGYQAYVIFDLDGVLTRYASWFDEQGHTQTFTPNRTDQIQFLNLLSLMDKKKIGPLILTNRPPGQMQGYATQFGLKEGLFLTESGASAYNIAKHKAFVTPRYVDFARFVATELRPTLDKGLGIKSYPSNTEGAQYEPGGNLVKTILIPPTGMHPKQYATSAVQPIIDMHRWNNKVRVKAGKTVELDPLDLSKAYGMELLLTLNGIDPSQTPVIFIADEARDIDAAQPLVDRGGMVGAVGNAKNEFKTEVRRHGGIVARGEYHAGAVEIVNQFITMKRL